MSLRFHFFRTLGCLTLLLFIMPGPLWSQYQDGLALLRAKKFGEARTMFQQLNVDNPVLGTIGLSKYYSTTGNPRIALDSAYLLAQQAEQQYKTLASKEKDQVNRALVSDSPLKNRQAIEKKWIDEALAQKKLEPLNRIMAAVGSVAATSAVEDLRNKMVYEEANKINTLEAYAQLYQQYGGSFQKKNPPLLRGLGIKLLDFHLKQEGWAANESFKTRYPLAAWVRDTLVLGLEKAAKTRFVALETYAKKYPGTWFAQVALDSLSAQVLRAAHWRYCAQVLQRNPQIPRQAEIWTRLYRGYRVENPSVKQLQSFKSLFPAFPHSSLLQEDEKTALTFYYQATLKSDSTARMLRFIADYPSQHPQVDSIWGRYAEKIHQKAKSSNDPAQLDLLLQNKQLPPKTADKYQKIQADWYKQLDQAALNNLSQKDDPALYFQFIDRPRPSSFRGVALDSLGKLLLRTESIPNLKRYLKYPDPPHAAALLNHYFNLLKQSGSTADLEAFAQEYPQAAASKQIRRLIDSLEFSQLLRSDFRASKWPFYRRYLDNNAPSDDALFALQKMIFPNVQSNDWASVLDTLDRYATHFKGKNTQYDELHQSVKSRKKIQNFERLDFPGEESFSVYSAYLSADEQQLFMCRSLPGLGRGYEDIYVSKLGEKGWGTPLAIPELSLPDLNEAPESVGQNANELLLFIAGSLYESTLVDGTWSQPQKLPETINFSSWQGDGRYITGGGIIYTAENAEGDYDLYVALKDEDGKWQTPINLGKTLNTNADERTPFLHPDMRTLYFCSKGHPGFGDYDIFVSTRLDDTWTKWSPPRNMGLLYNSAAMDWDFKVNTRGDIAYFSIGNASQSDIAFSKLPKDMQPADVYQYKVILVDENNEPLKATIHAIGKKNQTVAITRPDSKTGNVILVLPSREVKLIVIPDGNAIPIDLASDFQLVSADSVPLKPQVLKPTMINTKQNEVTLKTILFATGSTEVLSEAHTYLNLWARQLSRTKLRIEVQGHTDNTSSAAFNLQLSQKRADAIRDYLISKGCPADQIVAKGYGELVPFADNNTEEGRAQNRRVIFKLLK